MATAIILLAVSRILSGKQGQAIPLLLLAFLLHPIMGAMGISFCFFLAMVLLKPLHIWLRRWRGARDGFVAAAFVPLGWVFEPPTPAWREALGTRNYFFHFAGPGTSGWERGRLWYSSGCCGALPESAARRYWRALCWPSSSMGSFNWR